jgi:ubiquinone/menaquinone biosynthesis C-methylase UbiE
MAAMEQFLDDFCQGLQSQRYCPAALPNLPFATKTFDLALCSHLLFTYAEQLDFDFHLQAIQEMYRVAKEVRIFPLLQLSGMPYPHLETVMTHFRVQGYTIAVYPVTYEFQRGGNQMLLIR